MPTDPDSVIPPLFPYQVEGADWLAPRDKALLADEMGLGKTAQAITAAERLGLRKILVVCPAVVRPNWSREFDRFTGRGNNARIIATRKDRPGPGITIVSYGLLGCIPASERFDVAIFDESHYIKGRATKRTAQALQVMRQADRVWAMSGTPIPNNVAELWPLLNFFGLFSGNYWQFVKAFCNGYEGAYGYRITGHKNIPKLKAMLSRIMLRRRKQDVLKDLPPITISTHVIDRGEVDIADLEMMFPSEINHLNDLALDMKRQEKLMKAALAEMTAAGSVKLEVLEAFDGSTSAFRRYTGMQKVRPAAELIKMHLDSGMKKAVVFCQHRHVIERMRQLLSEYHPVTLYGGTPPKKRERNIALFQEADSYRVFIGNILAAGTGITLTAASDVFVIEPSYVPGDNAQAIMRVHRIGQKDHVNVRFIALADSIDEDIQKVIARKTEELTKVLD